MKDKIPVAPGPLPFRESTGKRGLDSTIADLAVGVFRDTEERKGILRETNLTHEDIEERLATGEARRLVLVAAVAHIFEQLPRIVHEAVRSAVDGNAAASKLILEIAGLKDSARVEDTPRDESETGIGPLEMGMLESLRQQVAAMPDRPEPPKRA